MHVKSIIKAMAVSAFILSGVTDSHAQFIYRPESARPLYSRDTLEICVMGDMMMHSAQIENAARHGYESYFRHLKERISSADIAVANMEFTHAGEPYTGYPAFSAPEDFSCYLAECGFDIFLCANNHILDKGCRGAERTLERYRQLQQQYGTRYCGAAGSEDERNGNHPLLLTSKGIRIAIINFTYGTNLGADRHWPKVCYMNPETAIEEALAKAEEADFTLVCPHWGTEYELIHSRQQREKAEWLAANGADMIIGTHPHVVQDYECVNGVPTAYSLGNAVSNMSAANTQLELMATIRLVRKPNGDIETLPLEFTWLWCSRPGGYCDSYTVLPVEEFISRQEEWKGVWDYEKMMATYERVRLRTGIKNNTYEQGNNKT